MSKALSYLLFACILIGSCAAHSKLWDEIEALEQKVAHSIGNIDAKLMEPTNKMNKVVCACENKDCQKTPEELSLPIIKSITDKIEKILSKDVFRTIVKRSVVDEEKGQDAKDEVKLMLNIYESVKKMFNLSDKKDIDEFRARLMTIPDDKQMSLTEMIQQIKNAQQPQKVEKIELVKSTKSMIQIIEQSASKCEEQSKKIECPSGSKISVLEATVSNKDKSKCSAFSLTAQTDDACTEEMISTHVVSRNCDGKESCMLSLDNELSKVCECAPNKYLDVEYVCVPEPSMSRVRRQAGKGGKGKKGGKGGKGGKGKKGKGGQSMGQSSGYGSKPSSGYGSQPSGGYGSQPSSGYGSKPSGGYGSQPSSGYGSAPAYTKPQPQQPYSKGDSYQTNYGTPYNYYKPKPQKVLTIAPRRFMPIPFPVPAPVAAPVAAPLAAPVQTVHQQPRSATVLTIQPTYQETPTYSNHQQQQQY